MRYFWWSVYIVTLWLYPTAVAQTVGDIPGKPLRNAATRMKVLLRGRSLETTSLTLSDFNRLAAHETFEDLDLDHSGVLDQDEFYALDYREVEKDFLSIARPLATRISEEDFQAAVEISNIRLSVKLRLAGKKLWDDLIGGDLQSAKIIQVKLIALDKAKVSASGPGLIPGGGGWVLSGSRKVEQKKIVLDETQSAVLLRLIGDYTQTDTKATAATFSWTKDKDNGSVTSINGAVRFDYKQPNGKFSPTVGIQINHNGTGDNKEDTRKIFLLGQYSGAVNGSFYRGGLVYIGPVYEMDIVKHFDKITGLVEFEPILKFGRFLTGVWVPLSGQSSQTGDLECFLAPRVALELNHVTHQSTVDLDPSKNPESSNLFRYGLLAGIRMYKQLTLKYSLAKRNLLKNLNSRYLYQEVALEVALDPNSAYMLTANYKRGEDSPSFKTIETINLGLGIKF